MITRGLNTGRLITRGFSALIAGYHEIHKFIVSVSTKIIMRLGK